MIVRKFFLSLISVFYFLIPLYSFDASCLFAGCEESNCFNIVPTDRFKHLLEFSFCSLPKYQQQLTPYLVARGIDTSIGVEALCRQDLLHIAQGLSILFEENSAQILAHFLGEHISLIEGYKAEIEHVGRELFGPISFYLPILKQIAPQLGLEYLSDLVFPSTEVVKTLQKHDPTLEGVTIGRVYFRSLANDKKVACLELFQASSQDEKKPQHFCATQERLAMLCCSKNVSDLFPIDHIAMRLDTIEDIQNIHNRISEMNTENLIAGLKAISQNLSDGSAHTKAFIRSSSDNPFNKIIEFVCYIYQIP